MANRSVTYKSKNHATVIETRTKRSRLMTAFLAVFFGGIGIHKFYLGKPTWGLAYIFFSWTFIPLILGIIEGISYLLMTDKSFELKYP